MEVVNVDGAAGKSVSDEICAAASHLSCWLRARALLMGAARRGVLTCIDVVTDGWGCWASH